MRRSDSPWNVWALVVLLVGALGSILGAVAVAHGNAESARRSDYTSSIVIASTLKLDIAHEQDLAASAGAFFIGNPNASVAQFSQWVRDVRAFERYPEIQSITEILYVRDSQLGAFQTRARMNSANYLVGSDPADISPPGQRPYYCFLGLEESRPGLKETRIPAGLDLCKTYLGPIFRLTRDTGEALYAPENLAGHEALAVGTPIFRGGVEPTSVAARRANLMGWAGTQILPSLILDTALQGHPHTAVAMVYRGAGSPVTFATGQRPDHATTTSIDLHNGWRVQVFSAPVSGGIFAHAGATLFLLAGLLLTVLLALLILVLGTSRSSALRLVRERTDQLEHQALHDSLTGLPNRALILDRIGQMLARARRQHTPLAALFLDLDNFKDINDTLGHRTGDALLSEVGTRLSGAIRDSDTVGRLGGDEFVILAEGASLEAGVEMVAERILDVLSTPFSIEGSEVPLSVTASIGIAEGDRATPEELLQDADIALYQAKAAGKRRAVIFLPSMQIAVDQHRSLEIDLQHALDTEQFFLLYQPTVDLATGVFTGVEALLRWRRPERGVVQPQEFIPELESSGLIIPVGAWVLLSACHQGAIWNERGHPCSISVNISARQLDVDRIVDDVRTALATSGLAPNLLILELTETTLMHDAEHTAARLRRLKDLGVRIAIDDFGTGYSSMAYLKQFPIDVLKIDRAFVSGIADSAESAALVHTLVQLGKVLGFETVAEGVETVDQRRRLESEHVDTGQGFLFARPLEVRDVDQLFIDAPRSHASHASPVLGGDQGDGVARELGESPAG